MLNLHCYRGGVDHDGVEISKTEAWCLTSSVTLVAFVLQSVPLYHLLCPFLCLSRLSKCPWVTHSLSLHLKLIHLARLIVQSAFIVPVPSQGWGRHAPPCSDLHVSHGCPSLGPHATQQHAYTLTSLNVAFQFIATTYIAHGSFKKKWVVIERIVHYPCLGNLVNIVSYESYPLLTWADVPLKGDLGHDCICLSRLSLTCFFLWQGVLTTECLSWRLQFISGGSCLSTSLPFLSTLMSRWPGTLSLIDKWCLLYSKNDSDRYCNVESVHCWEFFCCSFFFFIFWELLLCL